MKDAFSDGLFIISENIICIERYNNVEVDQRKITIISMSETRRF